MRRDEWVTSNCSGQSLGILVSIVCAWLGSSRIRTCRNALLAHKEAEMALCFLIAMQHCTVYATIWVSDGLAASIFRVVGRLSVFTVPWSINLKPHFRTSDSLRDPFFFFNVFTKCIKRTHKWRGRLCLSARLTPETNEWIRMVRKIFSEYLGFIPYLYHSTPFSTHIAFNCHQRYMILVNDGVV
jgi:hypothetical protein